MAAVDALAGLIQIIDGIKELIKINQTRKENYVEIYTSLKEAIVETKNFIQDNDGNHVKSLEIQKAWNNVLKSSMKPYIKKGLGKKFPSWINTKSEFWENPDIWINDEDALETVPSLNQLDDKVKELKLILGL